MQTHGYERSKPWKQALALIDLVRSLTAVFENDDLGLAGKLRAIASELPLLTALAYEQTEYDKLTSHAQAVNAQLFKLLAQAQLAQHLKLISPKQLIQLRKLIDTLDATMLSLADELFEDDGQNQAA